MKENIYKICIYPIGFWWFTRGQECRGMSFTPSFGGGSFDLDNGMYEEFKAVSGYVWYGLFSISEDGVGTRRMTGFWQLAERYQVFTKKFSQLRNRSCTSDGINGRIA